MNKETSLNLYAKIEPLIGFYQDYERLYNKYLQIINSLNPKNILDFGCGNGRLLERLKECNHKAIGIDLSLDMVEKALSKNVKAYQKDIKELEDKFELIIAAADVLNYLNQKELNEILDEISSRLTPKGYFLADINTLHGFANVAEGLLIKEEDSRFLAIEANFKNKKLSTKFTLFEQNDGYYKKEQAVIGQYFYPLEYFQKLKSLHLKKVIPIFMFDKKTSDKTLMLFQKSL
ncbi:MAG: class I SAM-dependent methyltransferase [Campylobacteraceae bacterium]|jgi:predicted TPR repeat methyltransferase|nr:class I SAM-dependent methyltransferase [Campylobacteraceae bacterium]